jgi:Glu-tRNA(Gln) amidotransferase subunit E-like FAD-binding protein
MERNSNKKFSDISEPAYSTSAYLRVDKPEYDRRELSKISAKELTELMDAVKEGNAPRYKIEELLLDVNKLAPKEMAKLGRKYRKADVEEMADFIYETRSRKAIADLTHVVIGILKTMVLEDYLRKQE